MYIICIYNVTPHSFFCFCQTGLSVHSSKTERFVIHAQTAKVKNTGGGGGSNDTGEGGEHAARGDTNREGFEMAHSKNTVGGGVHTADLRRDTGGEGGVGAGNTGEEGDAGRVGGSKRKVRDTGGGGGAGASNTGGQGGVGGVGWVGGGKRKVRDTGGEGVGNTVGEGGVGLAVARLVKKKKTEKKKKKKKREGEEVGRKVGGKGKMSG